ncbi:MAG TPA: segregation/condensation protein A [Candidatus Methanoculleus thermohydrogenotrophicum]|jgi:segregation and condensation protein A|nr:segregation/condensation protein A [Candidatus Methanoculleus thermohydrogenotrophicum]NLM81141.1 segregation/condensation protein A [Candidatus Methanoculleus thermohydrogenotrophicum]HOB18764.1 segregation/condensation protein A [Candidatus Methanoculleus thermohydrogenotrophicum]HPZ38823.1 segregation/condensation protein A [Candidatus Methanoculleus thermohydrogenotrophicum]
MDEEPVEILAGMAERGEVDPWNIDIVDVTDRFLAELEHRKELDLRVSGRTLFYAACLLRMKSEYLEGWGDDDGEDGTSFFDDEDEGLTDFGSDEEEEPIERLEREIQRRLRRKNLRKRPPVTLYELLKELKTAEKEQRRKQRRRKPTPPEPDLDLDAGDVVAVAHDEGYQKAVASVMEEFGRFARAGDGVVTLDELSGSMDRARHEVYIPLLFLMLEGKLALWQDEFFGEVYVGDHIPEPDPADE